MESKEFENCIVIRLDQGDEIASALLSVAAEKKISLASLSGIGATDDFEIGVFDLEKKDYVRSRFLGNHEITSLSGNVTTKDGAPYVHLHVTCAGDGGKVVGGHLFRANVSLTAEIFLFNIKGAVDRKPDDALRINKIDFN